MNIMFRENYQCWKIEVDGEVWREVHRSIFGKTPVFPPVDLLSNLQQIFDAYEYKRVKNYVLWRLSKQNYHSEQLTRLLKERLVQNHTLQAVIQEFKHSGFIDNEAWINTFMRSHQKKYSLRIILSKLRMKGLNSETLKMIEQAWHAPEEEMHALQQLLQNRYRSKDLTQKKERQKVVASLLRKGYSYENISKLIKL